MCFDVARIRKQSISSYGRFLSRLALRSQYACVRSLSIASLVGVLTWLFSFNLMAAPKLALTTLGGKIDDDLVLEWPSGEKALEQRLLLRVRGTEAVKGVKLLLEAYDTDGKPSAAVARFLNPISLKPLTALKVEPGKPVAVLLRMEQVRKNGRLKIAVAEQVDGQIQSELVQRITVMRLGAPWLTIQEADANRLITLTTTGSDLQESILLQVGGLPEEGEATITVGSLRASQGNAATVTPKPSKVKLTAGLLKKIDLSGLLVNHAAYRGKLTIEYGPGKKKDKKLWDLHIERQASLDKPAFYMAPTAAIELGNPSSLLGRSRTCMPFHVYDTNGRQLSIYPPTVTKLERNEQSVLMVPSAGERTVSEKGTKGVSGKEAGTGDNTANGEGPKGAGGEGLQIVGNEDCHRFLDKTTLTVEAGEMKPMTVLLDRLDKAGSYAGTLRVGTKSGVRAYKDFVVNVRCHWWVCVLWLSLGGAIGLWLSYLEGAGRVALEQDIALRRLLDRIARAIPDETDPGRRLLEDSIEKMRKESRQRGLAKQVEKGREQASKRFQNYLLIRQVIALKNKLPGLLEDPDQRLAELRELESKLQSDKLGITAFDNNATGSLVKEAKERRHAIYEDAANELRNRTNTLKTRVDDAMGKLSSANRPADHKELLDALKKVQADLQAAQSKLDAAFPDNDGQTASYYNKPRELYERAQKRYREQLAPLQQALRPSRNLIVRAEDKLKSLEMETERDELEQAINKLKAADSVGRNAARSALEKMLTDKGGGQMSADEELRVAEEAVLQPTKAANVVLSALLSTGKIASEQALHRRSQHRIIMSRLISGGVAIVGGVLVLWTDNQTWGGPGDYLTAGLFGMAAGGTLDQTFSRVQSMLSARTVGTSP